MRKLFSFLVLALFCISASAYDWSFCGNAAPTGWTDNNENKQANAFTKDNNGQLVWIGKLVTGGEGFKITRNDHYFGGWGDVHPSTPGLNIAKAGSDVMQIGGDDTKWTITSDGIYKMTIDEATNTLTCVPYTPTIAAKDGWYELGTAAELYEFAELVSHNAIARDSKVKLTADIDYTAYKYASIGRSKGFAFKGEFDGQGHTIKIDMVGIYERTGLFAYINAAVIKNLVIEGNAASNDKNCVGGFGGRSDGNGTLIENIVVKTAVSYTGSNGDATCGGLFANMEDICTLKNCAFLGSINSGKAEGNGGLVGWAGSGNNNSYINCLVAPTEYTKNGNSQDFARNIPAVTNSHKVASDDARLASGELCVILNAGGDNWYQNLGVDATPVPFSSHGKVYANGAFYCDGTSKGGEVVYGNTNENITDPHTFGTNGMCTYCKAAGQEATLTGDIYQLNNTGNLFWFAQHVNNGNASANASLNASVDFEGYAYTPIGNNANRYKGEFNGNGNTISGAVVNSDQSNIGVFGVITGGANIHDLVIGNTCSFTGVAKIGGIAGMVSGGGEVNSSNVITLATVKSTGNTDANAAGMFGCCIDGTKVFATNCLNGGSVSGQDGQCGAFSGWSQSGSKYTNCANIGVVSNMQDNRNLFRGSADIENCYDVSATANPTQGTILDAAAAASGELCYKLGSNFRQEIGTDAHPVLSNSKPNVVSAAVSAAGYATYVAGEKDVKFNAANLEAYVVSSIEGIYAKFTEVTEVPAGEAVVLKANEGTYYFNTTTEAISPAANQLVAATEDVVADGTHYVLAQVDEEVGFHKVKTGDTIAKGKGYLVLTGAAAARSFYGFGDNEDAINSVNANATANEAIYNLAGQRLNKAVKGLNIIDGKKVIR